MSGMVIRYEKSVARVCVCRLKGVILIGKSLLSHLVQEPSSYVIPAI